MNGKILITIVALTLSLSAFADGTRKIVKLTPAEGATNVPLSTTEISIEFDQPMAPTSSLIVPCGDLGATCLASGEWKSKTLFVVSNVRLTPGRKYTVGIGGVVNGMQTQRFGADGVPMTPVNWTFTAAAE